MRPHENYLVKVGNYVANDPRNQSSRLLISIYDFSS
jgi:hypothetical protein